MHGIYSQPLVRPSRVDVRPLLDPLHDLLPTHTHWKGSQQGVNPSCLHCRGLLKAHHVECYKLHLRFRAIFG